MIDGRKIETKGAGTRLPETNGTTSNDAREGQGLREEVHERISGVEDGVFLDDLLEDLESADGGRGVLGAVRELVDDGLVSLVAVGYGWGVEYALIAPSSREGGA